ncbi:acyltransferase family protein [Bradyrhizobium sp. HKCCYLS3077]|uniref:acyltransferase family protein n=1 Tax=Bradyrhizobium sp. HKCCYLS3077 TaxID=3420761 RepID=UPI003EB6C3C4
MSLSSFQNGEGMRVERRRIEYLDGLRGIAILAVVVFHGYVAFPDALPFGAKYEVIPIRLGWQGVQLFFLISGFVILMSLETCKDLISFLVRRWLRLFPAMLIGSLLILGFESFVGAGPNTPKTWINLVPGLTFLNPALIHALTGLSIDGMEGSFWSLYVEVVFYVIFAMAYFAGGRAIALFFIFSIFVCSLALRLVFGLDLNSLPSRVAAAADWIGFIHFGWFTAGALFYIFYRDRRRIVLVLALGVGMISAVTVRFAVAERVGLCLVVLLFAAAVCMPIWQRVLSSRLLLFFGFISYPWYLIHYPFIRALLPSLAFHAPFLPSVLLPVVPIACGALASWLIAKYGEPMMRRAIRCVGGPEGGQKAAGAMQP